MDKRILELKQGYYYHIFNRGNNKEKIFYESKNYDYFLKKFYDALYKYIDIYAYCLIPNHFHMLVKVLNESVAFSNYKGTFNRTISQVFANFFNGYSKSINKQENRYGNLFQRPYKRILIESDSQLLGTIYYIHRNPVHHGLCDSLEKYRWSSYRHLVSNDKTILKRKEVIAFFGNKNEFIKVHKTLIEEYKNIFLELNE